MSQKQSNCVFFQTKLLVILLLTSLSMAFATHKTAIVGVNIIDGNGGPPLMDQTIIMHKGKIKKIGPSASTNVPGSAEVIDATGKWVIPGMVDAHVHVWESGRLYTSPGLFDLRAVRDPADERAFITSRLDYTLTRFLGGGVTTAIDLSGPFFEQEIQDTANSQIMAPNVAIAGRLISDFAFDSFDFLWTVDDPALVAAMNAQHARELVQEQLTINPQLIKTGYFGAIPLEDYGVILDAIIDESHAAGLKVAVHAFELATAKRAIQAGADFLAHTFIDLPADAEFLQMAVDSNVIVMSTIIPYERIGQVVTGTQQILPLEAESGDPEVIATWADLATIPPGDLPPVPGILVSQPIMDMLKYNYKAMYDAGVRMAVGTDTGNIGLLMGASYHRELELIQEAGVDPMGIIVAATKNGAEIFGDGVDFGTIEEKKRADLVILDANPLLNISNTQTIAYVVKDGNVFTRAELSNLDPGDVQ